MTEPAPPEDTDAVDDTDAVERILERLRAAGGRSTEPRRAVIEALVTGPDHPTADDLAAHVAERHPTVHKSTVYRTLDALGELGLVDHVHLGHGRAVYHLTDDRSLHLLCDDCGTVQHVDAALMEPSRRAISDASGFVVEVGHFAIPGRCGHCVAATGSVAAKESGAAAGSAAET